MKFGNEFLDNDMTYNGALEIHTDVVFLSLILCILANMKYRLILSQTKQLVLLESCTKTFHSGKRLYKPRMLFWS